MTLFISCWNADSYVNNAILAVPLLSVSFKYVSIFVTPLPIRSWSQAKRTVSSHFAVSSSLYCAMLHRARLCCCSSSLIEVNWLIKRTGPLRDTGLSIGMCGDTCHPVWWKWLAASGDESHVSDNFFELVSNCDVFAFDKRCVRRRTMS